MKIVVFLNGEYNYSMEFIKTITEKAFVLCADGGANASFHYGVMPNKIVGDLDSIEPEILNSYKRLNVEIQKYPVEKDFSDFELILNMIKENTIFNSSEVIILGSSGGRIDYIINNLMLLEGTKNVTMITENEEIYYRDEPFVIENREEARVSFISLDDTIMNMTLKGFKYSIENKLIKRNTSQLVSNEVISKKAEVLFDKGKMLVILEKTLWKSVFFVCL